MMRASESGYVSVGASWQGPTEGVSGSLRRSRAPLLRCCLTLLTSPTSGSWLNVVEVFLGIITRQAIRRRTFTSVKGLIAAIETYIDAWNERCQPFAWTKRSTRFSPKPLAVKDHRSCHTRTSRARANRSSRHRLPAIDQVGPPRDVASLVGAEVDHHVADVHRIEDR
jgi:hypothetical protein